MSENVFVMMLALFGCAGIGGLIGFGLGWERALKSLGCAHKWSRWQDCKVEYVFWGKFSGDGTGQTRTCSECGLRETR